MVKEAISGDPIRISGIDCPNAAGQSLRVQPNDQSAKLIISENKEMIRLLRESEDKNEIVDKSEIIGDKVISRPEEIHITEGHEIKQTSETDKGVNEEEVGKDKLKPKTETSDGRVFYIILL